MSLTNNVFVVPTQSWLLYPKKKLPFVRCSCFRRPGPSLPALSEEPVCALSLCHSVFFEKSFLTRVYSNSIFSELRSAPGEVVFQASTMSGRHS